MNRPILLFAFANDKESNHGFLRNLSKERKGIVSALEQAEEAGVCEIKILPDATIEEIFTFFQKNQKRIAIFHFGGHANSYNLLLESIDQNEFLAHEEGLMNFLGRQRNLEVVFLNGCSTQQQAVTLQEKGVPAVIGTIQEVADEVASDLAIQFYKGLGSKTGLPLKMAWEQAIDYIKTKKGTNNRGLYRKSSVYTSLPPWKLNIRKGSELVEKWNLPDTAGNPLFGLPKLEHYDLPSQPYRFLKRYEKKEAPLFFGRGKKIRDLYFRVTDGSSAPIILFSGQSGVGKSSLLEAGLLPRLETSHQIKSIRRTPSLGLVEGLEKVLFSPSKTSSSNNGLLAWRKNWKDLEHVSGQPLVIVLDQVEGVFTRIHETRQTELADFLNIVQAIFDDRHQRPQGKLILSYRKEFDPDFRSAFEANRIPYENILLEPLRKGNIIAVVEGLSTTKALRRKYALTIEPGLSSLIADELIADRESPIAPVLQIILTKLWQTQEQLAQRNFTIAAYQQLKEEGILLQDFYEQQMEKIVQWDQSTGQDTVQSGLALDILYSHTTKWQVAERQTLEDLREQYEHRGAILDDLLIQFDSCYLLTWLAKNQTSLAHDTLAPIVHNEMEISDKKGQKALRILKAKTTNFQDDDTTILEPEDLKLVEAGKNGMRKWNLQERALVDRSRIYQAEIETKRQANEAYRLKSEHNRRRFWKAVICLSLLLALVGISLGWFMNRASKISTLVAQALAEEKTDPKIALQTINEAYELAPEDNIVRQTRSDIYNNNEFYDTSIVLQNPIVDLDITSTGTTILASGKTLQLWGKNQLLWENKQDEEVLCVGIAPNEQYFLSGGKDHLLKVWDTEGNVIQRMTEHQDWISTAIFLKNEQQILSGDRAGRVLLWDRKNKRVKEFSGHSEEVSDLAYSPQQKQFVSVSWDGTAKIQSLITDKVIELLLEGRGLATDITANGEQIIVGDRTGQIYFFNAIGELQQKIKAHERRLNTLQFSPDEEFILSGGDDRLIHLWDRKGNLLNTYRGHQDYVHTLAFTTHSRGFHSGSKDQTLKRWRLESKVERYIGQQDNEVSDLAISEDGALLVSGAGSGQQAIFNTINDLETFNSDLFFNTTSIPRNAYIWHLNEERPPDTLAGHNGGITTVAISQKANLVLTGSDDNTVRFWTTQGVALSPIIEHQAEVREVIFSKDSQWFATASYDSIIVLGKTATLLADTLHLQQVEEVEAIAFAPNQEAILVGLAGREAILMDYSGREIRRFNHNQGGVTAVAFSPEGERVVIGDRDNMAVTYSVEGDSLGRFEVEGENKTGGKGIVDIVFFENGKRLGLLNVVGSLRTISIDNQNDTWIWQNKLGIQTRCIVNWGLENRSVIGNESGEIKEIFYTKKIKGNEE